MIKVNTDKINSVAQHINAQNQLLYENFGEVEATMRRLDNSWDGIAASAALNRFFSIKAKYVDARYNIVNNYVRLLLNQVGEGYEHTENINETLAEAFK